MSCFLRMKRLPFLYIAMVAICLTTGCTSSKQVAYFQNIDTVSLAASKHLYDAKIMPKDMLTITVSTIEPEASTPFHLISMGGNQSLGNQDYLVDNSGAINFPVVGKIHVAGLTKEECQDLIRSKVLPYMAKTENPIVTVRMSSYRVTVIGEVNSPGVIPVTTEKISIIEALAQAGDLSIYGKRDNILLIREDNSGEKHIQRLNLNDAHLINSPYYYLQQNDVIYVQPNKVKARNADIGTSTTLWFSMFGIAMSVTSLVLNLLR